VGSRKSGKLHSAIEQAQAIQQREQLRVMIVDKFNKDFSKGNKNISKLVEELVADYFSKEKVTEDSLRVLKQRVAKAVEDYRKDNKSCTASQMQKKAKPQ
jgi:arabinogalactan endo-1,4-beta-galactosidase